MTRNGVQIQRYSGLLVDAIYRATLDCSRTGPHGIDGDENVWVVGALGWSSPESATIDAITLENPLAGSIAALVLRDRDR